MPLCGKSNKVDAVCGSLCRAPGMARPCVAVRTSCWKKSRDARQELVEKCTCSVFALSLVAAHVLCFHTADLRVGIEQKNTVSAGRPPYGVGMAVRPELLHNRVRVITQ